MSDRIDIPDLGLKIELLLRSDKQSVRSKDQVMRALGIGKDMWSRIQAGTRVLTEERFLKLCDLFALEQKRWYDPLVDFGLKLGFSRRQIGQITGTSLPGIDFSSRIRDEQIVNHTFDLIEGYWESFYFSVSRTEKLLVCRDLLIVRRVNDDLYIECEIRDAAQSTYRGWCFPIKGQLYFILERDRFFDEVIVYATNLPNRSPPRLYGVILCLSGDFDEIMQKLPCAAKVAFRHIGRTAALAIEYKTRPGAGLEKIICDKVAGYLDPTDQQLDADTKQIIRDISNVLPENSIPAALRMNK